MVDHSELVAKASRGAEGPGLAAPAPPPVLQRFIFLRGVQWSAPDMDVVRRRRAASKHALEPPPSRQQARP
jgi:hypothetical protein